MLFRHVIYHEQKGSVFSNRSLSIKSASCGIKVLSMTIILCDVLIENNDNNQHGISICEHGEGR